MIADSSTLNINAQCFYPKEYECSKPAPEVRTLFKVVHNQRSLKSIALKHEKKQKMVQEIHNEFLTSQNLQTLGSSSWSQSVIQSPRASLIVPKLVLNKSRASFKDISITPSASSASLKQLDFTPSDLKQSKILNFREKNQLMR